MPKQWKGKLGVGIRDATPDWTPMGSASGQAALEEHNVYGAAPGTGISMPPYYLPTDSVKNRNIYLPSTEPLGKDEMRITFMGSQPWPPRLAQAAECIMLELGNGKRLFFDFGPGCLRNIIANQVPVVEIDDIFLSHLHMDHIGDLPYLWAFSPFAGRAKPLHIIGPSGRTPELGTAAMFENMQKFGAWNAEVMSLTALHDVFKQSDVTEFDFKDDGGVCYDRDGVKVIHWRRSHALDGASAFRLDWNGLSFAFTGDGKPDWLTAKYAKGVDVFASEMAVDIINLWALKQGVPPLFGALTLDIYHTTHYGFGYLANLVQPRLAMATHLSFDRELLGEMSAGVRMFYRGFFAYGIDNTVVNVTKDRIWIREAALADYAGAARPNPQWVIQNMYGGKLPTTLPSPTKTIDDVQEQAVRDLEIDPALFTPPDQVRSWMRAYPQEVDLGVLLSGAPPERRNK
jgi:ribonuclease Z